jgi:hypothetical protein
MAAGYVLRQTYRTEVPQEPIKKKYHVPLKPRVRTGPPARKRQPKSGQRELVGTYVDWTPDSGIGTVLRGPLGKMVRAKKSARSLRARRWRGDE